MLIRDPGWKKFGSGINIPDPQHCKILCIVSLNIFSFGLQDSIQKLKDRLEQPKAKLMALHEKLAELKLNKTEIEVMYCAHR
jgi:hypothetical protein